MKYLSFPFSVLTLCLSLVACNYQSAIPIQAVEGIDYIVEFEEGTEDYARSPYLPLLDIIKMFEDFHRDEKQTRTNPYQVDNPLAETWALGNAKYEADVDENIEEYKLLVIDLINNRISVTDFLESVHKCIDRGLANKIYKSIQFLILDKTAREIKIPTDRLLFDFFMEDDHFQGFREPNEKIKLSTIEYFFLTKQLVQKLLAVLTPEQTQQIPAELLQRLQAVFDCKHPDDVGGPYKLLSNLIWFKDLSPGKVGYVKKLRKLIRYDDLRKSYPSNLKFVAALFQGIYYHTDPAITTCLLQLIREDPIKILIGQVPRPKELAYASDIMGNLRIVSTIAPADTEAIPLAITPQGPVVEIPTAISSVGDWLSYIEGTDRLPKTKTNTRKKPVPKNPAKKNLPLANPKKNESVEQSNLRKDIPTIPSNTRRKPPIIRKPSKKDIDISTEGNRSRSRSTGATSTVPAIPIPISPQRENEPLVSPLAPHRPFVLPKGLRSSLVQSEPPFETIKNPKSQDYIDKLFDPTSYHKITYAIFIDKIWKPNGGEVETKPGSHRSLVFGGRTIGGIYEPHGSDACYSNLQLQYLRAYALYIGIRPTEWRQA